MLTTKLLLKNHINNLPKSKRRQFLLNCIDNSNVLSKFLINQEVITDTDTDVDKELLDTQFCQVCKKYDFIRDKYEETCKNCGIVRPILTQQKTFEKIEYIKPGSNLVKITKDTKKITVDLNKINLWLQDTDPLARETQTIIDNLNTIFQSKSLDLPKSVQNTSVALWYNFNSLYQKYSQTNPGSSLIKKSYNKKAILALCTYYGASINKYTISLQQLSILFNINIGDIYVANNLFRELFKETDYYKDLNLQQEQKCEIKLSPKNSLIFNKIKRDLMNNFKTIKEPLQNKEYASIIYFITNKINTSIKYTLKDLEEKCNISTSSIAQYAKFIEKFYKNNPKLYKELIL